MNLVYPVLTLSLVLLIQPPSRQFVTVGGSARFASGRSPCLVPPTNGLPARKTLPGVQLGTRMYPAWYIHVWPPAGDIAYSILVSCMAPWEESCLVPPVMISRERPCCLLVSGLAPFYPAWYMCWSPWRPCLRHKLLVSCLAPCWLRSLHEPHAIASCRFTQARVPIACRE